VIIVVLLLLQIPLYLIRYQTKLRAERLAQVKSEIIQSWGDKQVVSCRAVIPEVRSGSVYQAARTVILPEVTVDADVTSEIRYRGIYQVPVYSAVVRMDIQCPGNGANIEIHVSDTKGLQSVEAEVDGQPVACSSINQGVLIATGGIKDKICHVTMHLRGSGNLMFDLGARSNRVKIGGSWDDPGFVGDLLPGTRTVNKDGFSAQWDFLKSSKVGVEFLIPAGSYQRIERTMTYATFFLIIFFFTLLCGEAVTKQEIHYLQYVVAAAAPVLFYLMLLAFSEHCSFMAAYTVSAAVIVLMVTGYARMFMGKTLPAVIMGVVLAASYVINYIILQMEDFALLSGTLILAVILGVVMILTGKINRKEVEEKTDSQA
jgi:inner membrane protein